jgi:hypothetical protein
MYAERDAEQDRNRKHGALQTQTNNLRLFRDSPNKGSPET